MKRKKVNRSTEAHSILEVLIEQAVQLNKTGKVEFSIPLSELGKVAESYEEVYLVVNIATKWDYSEVLPEFSSSKDEGEESESGKPSDSDKKH